MVLGWIYAVALGRTLRCHVRERGSSVDRLGRRVGRDAGDSWDWNAVDRIL